MAIRFACANCGKYHRILDDQAGLPGRCGRCKHRFIAPGNPVAQQAPSPVFIQTATPNLWTPPQQSWVCGLAKSMVGYTLVVLVPTFLSLVIVFGFRDRIVAFAPALAPMLPPKAVAAPPRPPARLAPPAQPAVASGADWVDVMETVSLLLQAMTGYAIYLVVFVGPLIGPPVLSRFGFLSVGRWLIMAVLAFFLLSVMFWITDSALRYESAMGLPSQFRIYLFFVVPLFTAVIGCLLAAVVNPKRTAL